MRQSAIIINSESSISYNNIQSDNQQLDIYLMTFHLELYMPPEAIQEEGAARYNTAIDIFSFGVVSLFTLTQTFPINLKPAAYHDPTTRRLVTRFEIQRREDYILPMKVALGETHPLAPGPVDPRLPAVPS